MLILGIETSCDETAAAILNDREVLAEAVFSQLKEHAAYSGVVPEIAARAHLAKIDGIVQACLHDAGLATSQLDGVAVTAGPGLIGGLATGVAFAKTIACVHGLPFFAINHLEGHALTVRLTDDVAFPYLLFLASGGHCQLLICDNVGQYRRIGTTLDDALGEAYDKIAKMMGLGYPGGPVVEQRAKLGDPHRFTLPKSMVGRDNCHFSFSGLKAAVRRTLLKLDETGVTGQDINDVCASFEATVNAIVADRLQRALKLAGPQAMQALVVAGGVAANQRLRQTAQTIADAAGLPMLAPPLRWCGDNAVMIAWAGIERARSGLNDDLTAKVRPRWPLDPNAEAALGAGVKA